MDYKPFEAYGVIGNGETVALVGRDGAIDWCCFPHVESPSVFARHLDWNRGGHFTIQPGTFEARQKYEERTNVLQTDVQTSSGAATVTDFMPVPSVARSRNTSNQVVLRKLTGEHGAIQLQVDFEPRFDYARTLPVIEPASHGIVAYGSDEALFLSSDVPLQSQEFGAGTTVTVCVPEIRGVETRPRRIQFEYEPLNGMVLLDPPDIVPPQPDSSL